MPDRLFADDRLRGEAHLVELGRTYDARQLRALGKHLLEVVDPEVADQEIAKQLEAEEEAAARATSFTLVDDGQGKAHGRFTVPSLHGADAAQAAAGVREPADPRRDPAHGGRRGTRPAPANRAAAADL